MLATCIVKTTRAVKRVSENAGNHAHVMSQNRISDRLWENSIRELMSIDNTLLLSLPKTEIAEFADDLVVSTPHSNIAIKHKNLMDQPVIHMAAIHTMGEEKNPNGTWAFRYAMHTKKSALTTEEGIRPLIGTEMHQCATIETKINRCRAYIMIDTGSTGNFISPAFTKVTGLKIFPLEQQLTLQLGCIGSRSKITHGGKCHIDIGSNTSEMYFDGANIDHYDCILGIPFLRECKALLNFADQKIQIGDIKITLLEEIASGSCQR
jgi:hypothetical protein